MEGALRKRSRTGCLTCRTRKLKCDETHPKCVRCATDRFSCDWPSVGRRGHNPHHQNAIAINPPTRPRFSLTARYIQCANSLTLTPQDRLFLEYFPSTTVYYQYNFSQWGALQYLVSEVAPASKLVTRMCLALSASEMHRKGLGEQVGPRARGVDPGLGHYTLGLTELQSHVSQDPISMNGEGLVAVVAALFFMIHYELHFQGSMASGKTHIRGLWALISSHPVFRQQQEQLGSSENQTQEAGNADRWLILSCQLVNWILSVNLLYLDIAATCAGASFSLLRLLTSSDNPILHPRRVNEISRLGSHRLWGRKLPVSHLLADAELYRPVEFGCQILHTRFHIWNLKERGSDSDEGEGTPCSLLDRLIELGKRYCDILRIADESPNIPWTPNMDSITRIATFYWACIIFHGITFGKSWRQPNLWKEAISKLTCLLFNRHQRDDDPRRQGWVVWQTFMAATETRDPIHRRWLAERLKEARHLTAEGAHIWSIAQESLTL